MLKHPLLLTAVLVVALATALCAPARAYLRVHPSNPHYFQETATGKPVLIASVSSIVPAYMGYDYVAGLNDTILRRRLSYSRVWWWGSWEDSNSVLPWGFSGQTGACYSVPHKFDLNTWNPTYFSRLSDAMSRANAGGVYAQIMIFERCCMSPADQFRWGGNAYASNNNINNLETPICTSDGTPEFYQWSTRPNLREAQERWVRKLIDETIVHPNMIYEIENEHWQSNSAGWADHYGQFVKDYIAANYPSSPRLVSYSSIVSDADLDQCFNWPAIDIVNRHSAANVTPYIESRWHYNKPINIDEFANGEADPASLRNQCWTIITSGGNFHIEDALDSARPPDICENIRSFIALSGWNFIDSAPDSSLITDGVGSCMANPGVEYLCYFPTGGSKTVNIAPGSYREEWWNPATGGFYNIANFSHGGGNRTFDPPDGNDWVLHVTASPAPTTVLASKPIGAAITIDGNPNDWNLAEFTTKIRGGSVGTGDTALAGFDSNLVCYVGGHLDSGQLLPTSKADHTATVYARDDASYLYFLIRCDDDDIRYPNGTSSNYLNDCAEIYIDPGHDRGSSAMSSSTSDVRLVIDAYNRKNVYDCAAGYASQVLAGVTSAVARDSSGWWLEARVAKTALSPAVPADGGTIGIDFCFHDNDSNNSSTVSTTTSWRDPEVSTGFPSKIPDRWGDLSLQTLPDTTAPAPVASLVATPGDQQVSLSWHNPPDADFTSTLIRRSTTGYPTGPTDGEMVVDKPKAPDTDDSHVDSGLTNGTTYYYSAFAHDAVPNYATKADASARPADTIAPEPVTGFTVVVGNERNFLMWSNPPDSDFAGVKVLAKTTGYPSSSADGTVVYQGDGTSCTHDGLTNGMTYYYSAYACDEVPNYSTAAQASGLPIYYGPAQAKTLGDGEELTLTVGAISAVFGDSFYVQCSEASCGLCGIKIAWPSYGLLVGQSATIKGTILSDDETGERYVLPTWVNASGSGRVSPVGMTNWALGCGDWEVNQANGAGQGGVWGWERIRNDAGKIVWVWQKLHCLNNIGLLVRVWGKVTQVDDGLTYFYIDDGSRPCCTTKSGLDETFGVRVKADPSGYAVGDYVTLTGISSCFRDASGEIRRQILPIRPPQEGPIVISSSTFDSDADGWSIATWKAHLTKYQPGTMAWSSSDGNPDGCMASTGSGATDNDDRCTREGGEIYKTISTWNHGGVKVLYDLRVSSLGGDYTGEGIGGCANDHDLIDEQLTVFYSTDGGANWIEAECITRGALLAGYQSFGARTIDLTGITACNNNANFALRFRWQFNQAADTGRLDNIRVEANQ